MNSGHFMILMMRKMKLNVENIGNGNMKAFCFWELIKGTKNKTTRVKLKRYNAADFGIQSG